jgi:hypothetical protein
VSAEATVIAVASAIYLFDCAVLLERGQALWSRGGMSFGSRHYQIRNKVVALLNPFTPFVPVFRTRPLFAAASKVKLSRAVQSLVPMAAMSLLQFALVFAALPYCLYRAPGWPFFMALVLAYANAIGMLGFIWWRYRKAGLAARPLLALGFGWLACLPLSVNALRKAGLAFDFSVDARGAIRYLPAGERQRARGDLAAQVAEAMHELEENDQRYRRLSELRRQLTPEADSGRV